MKKQALLVSSLFLIASNYLFGQEGNYDQYPYNKDRLISTPEKFHAEAISTQHDKFNTSFNPSGDTIYFTLTSKTLGVTGSAFQIFRKNEITAPELLPFASHDIPTADIQISPDGKTLLFTTFKDFDGKPEGFNFNLWKSTRSGSKWLTPQAIPAPIASKGNEFYPVITKSGTLYFNSDRGGNSDIYYSKLREGVYTEPIKLPDNINSARTEADAFISPDEDYIIFVRVDEEDGYGQSDLYISFNHGNDVWTDPINMGETINSSAIDGSPHVTPDGKYLIFTSGRLESSIKERAMANYESFQDITGSSNNGSLNFYIVSFDKDDYR